MDNNRIAELRGMVEESQRAFGTLNVVRKLAVAVPELLDEIERLQDG